MIKIYRAKCERLRLLMYHEVLEDIHWIIKVKVQLLGESSKSFISHMHRTCKHIFVKEHHAKQLKVYHRCARLTCNAQCHFLGMISISH
jgi:hypothetical protein